MSFFGDIVSGIGNAVGNVASSIGSAADNLVHLRVAEAAKNVGSAYVGLSGAARLNTVSGGAASNLVSKVPLIGSPIGTYLNTSSKIAGGDTSWGTVRDYGISGAETAAIAYGAGGLYSGAVTGASALTGAGTLGALNRGDLGGAFSGVSNLVGGIDLGIGAPNGLKDAYNTVSPFLPTFGGNAPTRSLSSGGTTLPGTGEISAGGGGSILPMLLIGAGAIGLYFVARRK